MAEELPKLAALHRVYANEIIEAFRGASPEEIRDCGWRKYGRGRGITEENQDWRLARCHATIEHYSCRNGTMPSKAAELPRWVQKDLRRFYAARKGETLTPLQKAIEAHRAVFRKRL